MTTQILQVQQVISRSRAILVQCMITELLRAIVCCDIAKRKQCGGDALDYVMIAEATSARYKTLHLQGKIFSKYILALMARLEEELGGTTDDLFPQYTPLL